MKTLFFIVALMITLATNAQSRLNFSGKEIFDEFKEGGIAYRNDTEVGIYLEYYPDQNVRVTYYLDADSICTTVLIETFTQEMTDFIINNYTKKGYLKVDTGWLMRDNGIIFNITHIVRENGTNVFLWY